MTWRLYCFDTFYYVQIARFRQFSMLDPYGDNIFFLPPVQRMI